MAPGSASGGCKGIHRCVADTRYLSIYLLRRASRNLHFDPPKLGDRPPTSELIRSSFAPSSLLLLKSSSLRTQLWPTGRRSPPSSVIVLRTALHQAGAGTAIYRLLCSVIYCREGKALNHPLCFVLCSRGGDLFYVAEGGTALYSTLCSGLYSRGRGQFSTV